MLSLKPLSLRDRYGKFYVDDNFIRNEPEVAWDVLSRFLIVEAGYDFAMSAVVYTALSPLFDKKEDGAQIPYYDLNITRVDDKVVSVEARRTS